MQLKIATSTKHNCNIVHIMYIESGTYYLHVCFNIISVCVLHLINILARKKTHLHHPKCVLHTSMEGKGFKMVVQLHIV